MDTQESQVKEASEHAQWWEGVKKEEMAKMEKMGAEEKMKNHKILEDFGTEVDAAKDWAEADWNQFKGRVQQWTTMGGKN